VKVIHWHKRTRHAPTGSTPRRLLGHRTNSDEGFTLVELIIVITIIPIVIAAISAAIITSFKDQAGVFNRLSDSHDAQLTSAYFVPDVESASLVNTSVTQIPCEQSLAGQVILELTEVTNGTTDEIFYIWNTLTYKATGSNQNALLRIVCTGTPNFFVQVGTNTIVAHSVTSATASLTCISPDPPPPPVQTWLPTWTSCLGTGGTAGSAGTVSNVSLNISEVPTNGTTQLDSFTYSLSATPRAWSPDTSAATGGSPLPSLLLLGPNRTSGTNLISFTGGLETLQTTPTGSSPVGDIDVDSQTPGSVSLFGNDTIRSSGAFQIYDCNPGGGNCPANVAVSPGTGGNSLSQATSMTNPAPLQDPMNLSAPSGPAPATSATSTGCPLTLGTYVCQPGLYLNGLTISQSNATYTFVGGGSYQFGQSTTCNTRSQCANTGLTISGSNDTITFASAQYVFEGSVGDVSSCPAGGASFNNRGGINVSGDGNTLQDNGAGVFFYLAGGPANFGCDVTPDNKVILSPMTSGNYPGVVLFANKSTSQPQGLIFDGFSTTGIVYAPDSYVDVEGTLQNSTGSLVAQSLQLSASLKVQ
jgi:prepilin-type N-terminal cleavage/methylation domain-containing protein